MGAWVVVVSVSDLQQGLSSASSSTACHGKLWGDDRKAKLVQVLTLQNRAPIFLK
jgi:hypothetical protein